MAVNLGQRDDGSAFMVNEGDGVEVSRSGGVPIGSTANASASVNGTHAWRHSKWAIMPLNAAAGVGASLASFKNTEPGGRSIYVHTFLIDVQTGSTASTTCKVDVGNLATSSGTTIVTALDLSVAGLFAGGWDGTAGGKSRQKMTTNQYLNMTMVSGSATGLVGYAVVGYIVL